MKQLKNVILSGTSGRMADEKTEKEWKKSKRIDAERMKAARALSNEKQDKTNLAFLDPNMTKVKGWSSDPNVILASIERMGNRSMALALGGVVLSVIGYVGGMVTTSFKLGAAGMMISGLPSGAGMILVGLAILMSLIVIGTEIVYKIKSGRKFSSSFWTAIGALVVVALYILVLRLII